MIYSCEFDHVVVKIFNLGGVAISWDMSDDIFVGGDETSVSYPPLVSE